MMLFLSNLIDIKAFYLYNNILLIFYYRLIEHAATLCIPAGGYASVITIRTYLTIY